MTEKICVYAICKNESKFVDRWVNSLKEADKIVVLDTGSTDDTVEKFKKYEPLVEVHQKIYDNFRFDVARNDSMQYIPIDTTICVVSDIDQVFRPGWADVLRKLFDQGYDEVYGPIIDYNKDNQEEKRFLSKNVHRYEKNHLKWSWQRAVHEGVYYDGNEKDLKTIESNNFVIEHHPDREKSRRQYLDILKHEYQEDSNNPYNIIYYGCETYFNGNADESMEVFQKGIKDYPFSDTDNPEIGQQVYINIGLLYGYKKDYKNQLKFAKESVELFPSCKTRRSYILIAQAYKNLNDISSAVEFATQAIKNCPKDPLDWTDDRTYYNGGVEEFIQDCIKDKYVCVYAIGKHEEKNIDQWYNKIKSADSIVVINTGYIKNNIVNGSEDFDYKCQEIVKDNSNFYYYKEWFGDGATFNFAKARNYALDKAREITNQIHDKEVIFVSLDFDEFLEDYGIEKIKAAWKRDYDTMKMIGITNKTSEQEINYKIHSNNPDIHWIRHVHETLKIGNKSHNEWNILIPLYPITYDHKQDLTKSRNYYASLLMENAEEKESNALTLTYLAWEAGLHNNETKCAEYAKKAVKLLEQDSSQEYYQEFEYIIQNSIYIVLKSTNDSDKYVYANKIYNILFGERYQSFRYGYQVIGDYYRSINAYNMALQCYEEELKIESRPYCWIDHDDLYGNKADAMIHYLIAICAYYTEDYTKAFINGDEAINLDSENQTYINDAEQWFRPAYRHSFDKFANTKIIANKVCVYAITKNESQFVDKWYESMKEADSIVVLDTGSTDDTVEKLRSHGITVKQMTFNPWRFDIARNEAERMVPDDCNILISTDLDEILEPGWAQLLRDNWIEGKTERAEYKYTWSHLADGSDGRVFAYNKVHSRHWIWKYPVHELLAHIDIDSEEYPSSSCINLFDSMHLHHYPDLSKSRGSYLPLLEMRAKLYKKDWYGLIYLAHEYCYRKLYQKSIDEFNYILSNYADNYSKLEQASCYLFMGDDYKYLEKSADAASAYLKAIDIDPTYREPYLGLAEVLINQNYHKIAVAVLKTALDKTYRHYTWLERDTSWTYEIYDLLDIAYFYDGNVEEALKYAEKALECEPDDKRLQNNVQLCKNNLQRSNDI